MEDSGYLCALIERYCSQARAATPHGYESESARWSLTSGATKPVGSSSRQARQATISLCKLVRESLPA